MNTHSSNDSHMQVQYSNFPAYTEESKMRAKTGDLELDNSPDFYHNTSPGITTVHINLPTDQSEQIEAHKSLFDQNSKFIRNLHNLNNRNLGLDNIGLS